MKIIKFTKLKRGLYEIIIDGHDSIKVYDDVIIKFNLLANRELNEDKLREINDYNLFIMYYYMAIKYIKFKLRTTYEVHDYLVNKGCISYVAAHIIDRLILDKYINDELYIKCFVNDKINLTLDGPGKIRLILLNKCLNKEKIDDYLSTIDKSVWESKIDKIIEKKIKTNKKYSEKVVKNCLYNILFDKGYSKELCMNKINSIHICDDEYLLKEIERLKKKYKTKYDEKRSKYVIGTKLRAKGFNYSDIDRLL